MSESSLYVTYYVTPQQRSGLRRVDVAENVNTVMSLTSNDSTHSHKDSRALEEFLNARSPKGEVVASFTDVLENRKTAKWPQLHKALETCRQKNALLLIIELGTLASNGSFTEILLSSKIAFHCLDQPFINQTILEALSKHAEVQRKLHGKLIREGLKLTSAKSGNPNAAEVISKVNKPKIDTAIVFALLLQPIIQDYRRKEYSQRQMVKTLNEEGFTAPEGGKWVLSQLQKVLERVRRNEIAIELKPLLEKLSNESLASSEIAIQLNSQGVSPLKQPQWDETQVKQLQDRLQQIKDITLINRFVLNLLPLLHEYRKKGLIPRDIIKELHKTGIPVREPQSLALAI